MKKAVWLAISLAVVFGAAFAAFGLWSPAIWNSPDETAVAFFARYLSESGQLWASEVYNVFGGGLVHPRSILVVDGFLVPGFFVGSIFYFAALFKLLGPAAFAVGTPLLTAAASLVIFAALSRIYDRPRAIIAQVLFLANPAVWYFTSRGLYPNVIFIDLAVIGAGLLYLRPWRALAKGRGNPHLGAFIDDALGLAFLGAAFLVRPVEFIWLAPLLLFWLGRAWRRVQWLRLAYGLVIAAAAVGALLATNASIYGGPWNFGYTAGSSAPGISLPALEQTSRLPGFLSAPRPFILPFGFHPRAAVTHLWDYLVVFQWWLPLLAALGFLLTKDKTWRRRWCRAGLWTAGVLGVYYGSGVFVDSSVSQWTVGSSYLRYFLPASVLLVPLAAEGLWLAARPARRFRPFAAAALVAAAAALGGWTVYSRSAESLVPMRAELARYEEIKDFVLKETIAEDIIITERSDKIFFPDRKVVLNLRDASTLDLIPRLAIFANFYYFGVTISAEENPKIQEELHERGFVLGRIRTFGNDTFYGITREK